MSAPGEGTAFLTLVIWPLMVGWIPQHRAFFKCTRSVMLESQTKLTWRVTQSLLSQRCSPLKGGQRNRIYAA